MLKTYKRNLVEIRDDKVVINAKLIFQHVLKSLKYIGLIIAVIYSFRIIENALTGFNDSQVNIVSLGSLVSDEFIDLAMPSFIILGIMFSVSFRIINRNSNWKEILKPSFLLSSMMYGFMIVTFVGLFILSVSSSNSNLFPSFFLMILGFKLIESVIASLVEFWVMTHYQKYSKYFFDAYTETELEEYIRKGGNIGNIVEVNTSHVVTNFMLSGKYYTDITKDVLVSSSDFSNEIDIRDLSIKTRA